MRIAHLLVLAFACCALDAQPNVYTVDIYNNAVTVIDSATNKVVTTMSNFIPGIPNSFSAGPCHVAVTPDGTQAFVSNYKNSLGALTQLDVVTAIDTKTNKTKSIPIDASLGTYHMAVSPDSKWLYVPINTGQTFLMLVIDTGMESVVRKFAVNGSPGRMAVSPDGSRLWIPNLGDTKVDVFDVTSGSRLNRFDLGVNVDALAFSPDGATVYVTSEQGTSLFAITVATGSVSQISTAVPNPKGFGATFVDIAVSPDGNRLYITQNPSPSNNIAVVDLKAKTVTTPLPETSGEEVSAPFVITPDGKTIFAIDQTTKTVSINSYDTTAFGMTGTHTLTGLNNTFFLCGMAVQPASPAKAGPPAITSVVNGASFQPPIAAAAWTTIKGTNLSSTTRAWGAADFVGNKLPTSLDGVSATINGLPAYVYYISPAQVNVLAPDDPVVGTVPVVLTTAGASATVSTTAFPATKAAFSPAFFLFDATHPVATHANGSLLGPPGLFPGLSTQAQPGETIVLYGTGFGAGNPPLPAGVTVATPSALANTATVQIGGLSAPILFAGITGSGLDQLNLTVPATAPDGDLPIIASVGGASSPGGVVLTVHR